MRILNGYSKNQQKELEYAGTIIKIDYCPMCGRELDDSV